MVSPFASIATKPSIFFLRPSSVFIALVRNVRAKRFCAVSVSYIACAFGTARIAARRSGGASEPLMR